MSIKEKIKKFVFKSPKKSLVLASILFLFSGIGLINIDLDFGVRIWFKKDDLMVKDFDKLIDRFGTENYVFAGIKLKDKDSDIFTNASLQDIQEITDKLWEAFKVVRVESITNFTDIQFNDGPEVLPLIEDDINYTNDELDKLKKYSINHNILPGLLISRSANSAHFLIRLDRPDETQITYGKSISEIRDILKKFEDKYSVHIVGTSTVIDEFKNIAFYDLAILIPLLLIVVGFILYLILKSTLLVSLVFAVISATVVSTMGISGLLGIKLNNLSSMVPSVLVAIAIADAIHFINSIRQSNEIDLLAKLHYSFNKNFKGTILTTLTTSIGFFSLTSSSLVPILDFGLLSGIGTIFAWIYSILIIFPILVVSNAKLEQNKVSSPLINPTWLTDFNIKNSKILIFLFVIIGGTFTYFAGQNSVNSNPFEYFKHSRPIYQDNQMFQKEYGGFSNFEVMVDSGQNDGIYNPVFLKKVSDFQEYLRQTIKVSHSLSLVDYSKKLNQVFLNNSIESYKVGNTNNEIAEQLLYYTFELPNGLDVNHMKSIDNRFIRVTNFWNVQSSTEFIRLTKKINSYALANDLKIEITGREYLFNHMNDYVVESYVKSIGITLVIICILMMFILKSFSLGLLSLIPNVLPILVGAGVMRLMGKPLDVGTVLVASVCFGIAIDDTIHFFLETKKEINNGKSIRDVFIIVFSNTGNALVITTLTLAVSFLLFLFAGFIPNYNFGFFTSLILVVALLADLVLLPSILYTFYRRKN